MARTPSPEDKQNKSGLKSVAAQGEIISATENKKNDLCSTCSHVSNCGFWRDISRAVIECDGYDIISDQPSGTRKSILHEIGTAFKGLCVNCDIRHECKFPKPAEGVWRCDEYV